MPRIRVDELHTIVSRVLASAGALPSSADVTARAICYAETSGVPSHGLVRVAPLCEQLTSGKINGSARFAPSACGPALLLLDAHHGLGYAAAHSATTALLEALRDQPVVIAAVSRSHHFGMAGQYAERIAESGHVGLVFSGTVAAIAPPGGRTPLLGNPPIAVAAPLADASPVVVDLAPAVAARGNVVAARDRGEPIPEGWALDAEGRPTTDSEAALRGTMAAMGGDKGVILALLVDVLIAALTTSSLPADASSVFTPEGPPPELGHVIMGFDPRRFGVSDTGDRLSTYLMGLRADGERARIPGERRRNARNAAASEGVLVDDRMWQKLTEYDARH